MPCSLRRRRTLAGLSHRFLESFAVRSFAGQLRHLLGTETAARALHPIRLHHHRRRVLKAGQIPHFPLAGLLNPARRHMLPAPRANQLQPCLLPPHPQLQPLSLFINLFPINPVSRPSQNARPVVFSHPLRLAPCARLRKPSFRLGGRIPAQRPNSIVRGPSGIACLPWALSTTSDTVS